MPWKSPEFALATFQHSPAAQLLTDAEAGTILAANHKFAELFGRRVDEVVGRTTADLALWHDRSQRVALVERLDSVGEFGDVELLLCDASGVPIPVEASGSVLTVKDHRAYLIVMTDLRPRKALEAGVAAARASFAELFASSPLLLTLSDLSAGRFLDCNQAFCRVTGFSRDEVVGTVVFDLPLWEDPQVRRTIMREMAEKKSVTGMELRFRHKKGHPIWGRCSFSVTRFEGVQALVASIEDITEAKALQHELALRNSVLNYLFEHSDDPLYVKDREGRFLVCNAATARMIGGYRREQVEGRLQAELIAEPALSEVQASDQKVFETEATIEYEQKFAAGGQTAWALARKGPWRDEAGRVAGVVGVSREITAQKLMEANLRHQNQTKDRLLTVLAHDLRGPVGGSVQLLGLVAEQVKDQPDLLEIFELLQKSTGQTYDLLENLLAWIQGRLASQPAEVQTFDVASALTSVEAWLGPLAIRKRVRLEVVAQPGVRLAVEERTMQTIVRNLVSNAIKFTPPEGRITLSSRRLRGQTRIAVTDTGVGMDDDQVRALFQETPVTSQKGTGGEGGSGLGLMFCADLVRDLGGTIGVTSKVGQGTTFTLTFDGNSKS